MRDLEYIYGRIKAMNIQDLSFKQKILGTKKEVIELQNILKDTESLDYIASGVHNGNTWLIAVTSIRLIFLNKGMILGLKQKDILLDKISSINIKKSIRFGQIFIDTGNSNSLLINQIFKKDVSELSNILNNNIESYKNDLFGHTVETNPVQTDLLGKIKELANLKDQGFLTEEEFIQAKSKLLNS